MAKEAFQTKEEDKNDTGPLKDRGCTDIICVLIFIVFLGGMGVIAYFAFTIGDPWRIYNGYDSYGNTCGSTNVAPENTTSLYSGRDMTNYPYLFYFDPTVMVPSTLTTLMSASDLVSGAAIETTMMICVSKCPDFYSYWPDGTTQQSSNYHMSTYRDRFTDEGYSVCNYDFFEDMSTTELDRFNKDLTGFSTDYDERYITSTGAAGPCPPYVFNSEPILNRCIPFASEMESYIETNFVNDTSSYDEIVDKINDLLGTNVSAQEVMQYAMTDVMNSYREIAVMCGASLVISFIIILLLGWVAQIMIYTIAIATAIACIAGPAYFWYVWYTANEALNDQVLQLQSEIDNVETLMIYAIILTVVCVIVLLLIIFLRSRVGLMVTLFKEAGFMVMRMIVILFTPIVLALFIFAWAGLWTFVSGYIYTSGEAMDLTFLREYTNSDYNDNITFIYYQDHDYINYVWLYHLFGLYWGTEFFLACHEMAIAGAFVQFYWTRDKSKVHFPVVRGIWWVFRYHLGTVAFGSCIIAIIQLIRTILAYIQNKTKDSTSEIVKYLLMCLQCCLWCFEKVMKFINRNAYIYTAFKGTNFCSSCKKVFGLLMSNLVRVGVINCVGSFILFMGKFLVVIIVGCLGYFMMNKDEDLYYWAIPVLIAAIFAFAVAHTFFSVYEIGIDTIFVCFAEDETINDGTAGREYYMSKNLMQWVDNSGEALKNLKKKSAQQKAAKKAGASAEVEMSPK